MDEVARIERIDALADRKLNRPGENRPATEVWDEARDEVDTILKAEREAAIRAWEADRRMVADMERDGLL